MNAHILAHRAYSGAASAIRQPRAVEYELFASVTHGIRDALQNMGATGFPRLVEALHENRRLWTTLAADVADPGNALPPDLRARVFYLAQFTDHHTAKVLAGDATADVLIDINTSVMRGLQGSGAAA